MDTSYNNKLDSFMPGQLIINKMILNIFIFPIDMSFIDGMIAPLNVL